MGAPNQVDTSSILLATTRTQKQADLTLDTDSLHPGQPTAQNERVGGEVQPASAQAEFKP